MAFSRYSLPAHYEDIKTGKLLYVSKSRYATDWKSIPHTHYFSELFYCLNGRGEFQVENHRIAVGKGDVVIVNPHIKHRETSTDIEPLEYIVLGIESLCFAFGESEKNHGVFHLPDSNPHNELNELFLELQQHKPYYELICQNLLDTFLFRLLRDSDYHFSVIPQKKIPTECSTVKQYIDTHFADNITLDSLAGLVHLNKFYLAHAFSEAYGISLMSYLLALRLRCAQDNLAGTDYSIAEVSQVSGFSSQSYFCQFFKKCTGITPSRYRKKVRNENTGEQ